jgi:hypothetical protein
MPMTSARVHALADGEKGQHWITFLQSPLHALQLGTCCVGDSCEQLGSDSSTSTHEMDFMFKGFKGEWHVVLENSQTYPMKDPHGLTLQRSPSTCLFPYDNCNKGDTNAYRNDLVSGIIPKSEDGLPHRMWAKFVCREPTGCAILGTKKLSNKQMPEDEANFIASDATSQILRYKIAAVGCLPGEGLHSNGKECTACPEHFVSPYVGPALTAVDTEQPSLSIPSTCTRCPAGKTLPEGSELPNFKGLELLECAFHLDGKTSDGNKTHMKCPHVGYGKQSEVFSVTQNVGEVIYLGTRFCGANRCNQFSTKDSCELSTTSGANPFVYEDSGPTSSSTNKCKWSSMNNQCVAVLRSSLAASEVTSPPKKIRDRTTLNYIRKLQSYAGDGEFYQESIGFENFSPRSQEWPSGWQEPYKVFPTSDDYKYEYTMKLEAVQYKRNVFIQATCQDPLGCPGLRVSVEARGCAPGSYGR